MRNATKRHETSDAVDLPTILTDARTFAGTGRIVDKSIANWLTDCGSIDPKILGRMLKKHVLQLDQAEAGRRVQEAFAALDEENIGRFFKRCAEERVKRHKDVSRR